MPSSHAKSSAKGTSGRKAGGSFLEIVAVNRYRKLVLTSDDRLLPIVSFVYEGEEVDDPAEANHIVVQEGPEKFWVVCLLDYKNGTVN